MEQAEREPIISMFSLEHNSTTIGANAIIESAFSQIKSYQIISYHIMPNAFGDLGSKRLDVTMHIFYHNFA